MTEKEKRIFKVSVVIPAFNEEGNIEALSGKLVEILDVYGDYEIIFVDDGSRDGTLEKVKGLREQNRRIEYISLARNFGHQNALKAGIDAATGDCVISMDADLQHPPQMIPQMIDKWLEGYDVVYTVRQDDPQLSWFKRKTSAMFYKLMNGLSDIHIKKGMADFRLLDRAVVDVFRDFRESHLFFRGMTAWVGFRQYALEYIPDKRYTGQTKYSFRRMVGFALTGITSFSIKPLRLSILLGIFLAGLAFIYGIYAIVMKLFSSQVMPGWTSVLVSVLFIGGVQLIVMGIIGEYIGKLLMESKRRPHYVIKERSQSMSHVPQAMK